VISQAHMGSSERATLGFRVATAKSRRAFTGKGDLTIAACVSWYDEPLESLERCIRSLTLAADVLVISDGRWRDFHDEGPTASPREQRDLVWRAAIEAFPDAALIYERGRRAAWASQIAKRAHLYSTAARIADWILVIDADEHLETCRRDELDATLAKTDRLVAQIGMRTVYGPSAPEGVWPMPRLFATVHGLDVEHSHNGIRTSDGRFLTGDPKYVSIEPSIDVTDLIRGYHSQGAERPHEREMRDRRYRRRRRETGAEGWPGDHRTSARA
jgi:hypothetical protein